jgi:cysteine synthase
LISSDSKGHRLAGEEEFIAETSPGANVVTDIRLTERLGPDAKTVMLMVNFGLKYLSADVYR